jgi:hypothetical protein
VCGGADGVAELERCDPQHAGGAGPAARAPRQWGGTPPPVGVQGHLRDAHLAHIALAHARCEYNEMRCEYNEMRCEYNEIMCEYNEMRCEYNEMRCEYNEMMCEYNEMMRCQYNEMRCEYNEMRCEYNDV